MTDTPPRCEQKLRRNALLKKRLHGSSQLKFRSPETRNSMAERVSSFRHLCNDVLCSCLKQDLRFQLLFTPRDPLFRLDVRSRSDARDCIAGTRTANIWHTGARSRDASTPRTRHSGATTSRRQILGCSLCTLPRRHAWLVSLLRTHGPRPARAP